MLMVHVFCVLHYINNASNNFAQVISVTFTGKQLNSVWKTTFGSSFLMFLSDCVNRRDCHICGKPSTSSNSRRQSVESVHANARVYSHYILPSHGGHHFTSLVIHVTNSSRPIDLAPEIKLIVIKCFETKQFYARPLLFLAAVSYTHLTLPTIYSV